MSDLTLVISLGIALMGAVLSIASGIIYFWRLQEKDNCVGARDLAVQQYGTFDVSTVKHSTKESVSVFAGRVYIEGRDQLGVVRTFVPAETKFRLDRARLERWPRLVNRAFAEVN